MYELLQLENFKDFTCIGDKCSDNCCHSWTIYINKSTYKKYKKNNIGQSGDLVIVNKNNTDRYAKIKLKENGDCPFLDEEGLCNVHKNHGRQMLSNVCKVFPQRLTKLNNRLERTVKLSCPAAIELLFKDKKPLEFRLDACNKNNAVMTNNADSINYKNFDNENIFLFRGLVIKILQDRDFSIKERLYKIGKICDILDNLIASNEYSNLELKSYIYELETTYKVEDMFTLIDKNLLKDNEKDAVLLKMIPLLDEFLSGVSIKNSTNIKNVIENGLNNTKNIQNENLSKFKKIMNNFFQENDYVLEHYLVCKVFEEVFPKNSNSFVSAFDLMLNKLLMLEMYFIALYNEKETFDLSDFKNTLYFYERQLNHSTLKAIIINNLNEYLNVDWDTILDILF